MWRMGTLVAALGGVMMIVAPAGAESMAKQYKANLQRSHCESLTRGADFLAGAQVLSRDGRVGWSWQAGAEALAPNQAGLVSLGLLDAYEALGHEAHLQAVERYAEALCRSAGDGALAYKTDVELLARLARLQGQPVYRDCARRLFEAHLARAPSGESEVRRIAKGREAEPSLLGFDVALGIRAALALGERRYAYGLADALLKRSARWYRPRKDSRFSLLSAAALIPALERLDAAQYRRPLARLRADLRKAQGPAGAWLSNESQLTAYAVLALSGSPLADERQAARRGATWLRNTALSAGSHATFNDYMPEPFVGEVLHEVSAEALQALAPLCRAELRP